MSYDLKLPPNIKLHKMENTELYTTRIHGNTQDIYQIKYGELKILLLKEAIWDLKIQWISEKIE